jgi:hypothetical protein
MRGKLDQIHPDLLALLGLIEHDIGFELNVTSGKRDNQTNILVGGVNDSEHIYNLAEGVDIECTVSWKRYAIIGAAYKFGCKRIGDGETFIHIGIAKDKPQKVLWHYYEDSIRKALAEKERQRSLVREKTYEKNPQKKET